MPASARDRIPDWVPAVLVIWATVFNGVLAIVNAHVKLTPNAVIGAEVLTTLMSFGLALQRFRPEMRSWWVLTGVMIVFFSVESLARGDLQIKYVRDVLIIPTFILLGMTAPRRRLDLTVCIIHAIVIAVMLYEALDSDGFAKQFDIQGYYINTRGYSDDNFWNKESELFVNAVRPGDRFFLPFLDLHRLSSLFLEPVSLGNYCIVITAFICARFRELAVWMRLFLIVGNVMVVIGCDGRLAAITCIVIIAVNLVAARTPRGTAVFYLPLTVLAAFLANDLLGFENGPDDLPGRIAHTVQLLRQYELQDYFALSDRFIWLANDSGIAYLLMTQTILGTGLIWIFIIFGAAEDDFQQTRYTHALSLYLSLSMMVSFSMLSLKTAGLLWFVQGCLQRREDPAPVTARNVEMTGFGQRARRSVMLQQAGIARLLGRPEPGPAE